MQKNIFLKDFIYLIEKEWAREHKRDRQAEGEADSPLSGSRMWDLILGPWDHDLSQRQMLIQLSHPGVPEDEHSLTGAACVLSWMPTSQPNTVSSKCLEGRTSGWQIIKLSSSLIYVACLTTCDVFLEKRVIIWVRSGLLIKC